MPPVCFGMDTPESLETRSPSASRRSSCAFISPGFDGHRRNVVTQVLLGLQIVRLLLLKHLLWVDRGSQSVTEPGKTSETANDNARKPIPIASISAGVTCTVLAVFSQSRNQNHIHADLLHLNAEHPPGLSGSSRRRGQSAGARETASAAGTSTNRSRRRICARQAR